MKCMFSIEVEDAKLKQWTEAADAMKISLEEFAGRALDYAALRQQKMLGMTPGDTDLAAGIFSKVLEIVGAPGVGSKSFLKAPAPLPTSSKGRRPRKSQHNK